MTKSISFFLVDDDIDDTELFREMLYEADPSILFQSAVNGQKALLKLRQQTNELPDIIFLDLNMPSMNGKECLRELKSDEILLNIPVIIYSTSSKLKDIEELIMVGAVGFITKPTSPKELRKILLSISHSLPHNLEGNLHMLKDTVDTFIVS